MIIVNEICICPLIIVSQTLELKQQPLMLYTRSKQEPQKDERETSPEGEGDLSISLPQSQFPKFEYGQNCKWEEGPLITKMQVKGTGKRFNRTFPLNFNKNQSEEV